MTDTQWVKGDIRVRDGDAVRAPTVEDVLSGAQFCVWTGAAFVDVEGAPVSDAWLARELRAKK